MSGNREEGFKKVLEEKLASGRTEAERNSEYSPDEPVMSEPRRIVKPQTEAQKKLADLLKSSVPTKKTDD
eukprot:jgi/Galph1/4323/GphlegSOOS_G2960.1